MTKYTRLTSDTALIDYLKGLDRKIDGIATKGSGDIIVADPETGVETIIGTLPDGSTGFEQFVGDTTPPPVATAPYVSAQPGNFVVTWDGHFVASAEQPRDFVHVNVIGHKMAVDGTTTTISVPVGVIRTVTEAVLVTLDVAAAGESWQFSLEAEDYSGNKAAWSARTASIVMIDSLSTVDQAWIDMNNSVTAADQAAADAQASAQTAQDAADAVAADLTSTNAQVAAAQQKADQAFNNAVSAANAAGTAQSTADGKNRVWYQTAAPAGTGNNLGDLWFDTDDGNKPYAWSGSAWVSAQDATIAAAAATASAAKTSADGKNKIYYQTAMPTGGTYIKGDTWFDTDDGYKIYIHNGTTFVASQDTSIAAAQSTATTANNTANSKTKTFIQGTAPTATTVGDIWIDTANGNVIKTWEGSSWVTRADAAIAAASSAASAAQTAANGKNTVFYQNTAPSTTGRLTGDTWFDTGNGNRISVWNGSAWTLSQDASISAAQSTATTANNTANSKTKTFIQNTAPTATTQGDIWIDTGNGNVIKTWEGSAWVNRADTAIAAAASAASGAQNAANGKNRVYYQTAQPSGGTYITGDTWFDTDDGNRVYVYNGSAWTATDFGPSAIADLAITNAKIKDGTIQSAKIGSVDAGTITVGTLSAQRIGANSLTADKLMIGSTENLLAEPTFTNAGVSWSGIGSNGISIDATGSRSATPALKIVNSTPQQSSYNLPMDRPVEAGAAFLGSFWFKSDVATPASGVTLGIRFRLSNNTYSYGYFANSAATPANTWTRLSGRVTAPTDAVGYSVYVASQTNFTTGNLWVDFVSLVRASTGELIVDGAIQAGSAIIANGAIGNAQIGNAAVDTAQIKDAAISTAKIGLLAVQNANIDNGTIQAAKIGSVDAGTITVGTLSAARIGAGSVTADKVLLADINNYVENPDFESDTVGQQARGYTVNANSSVVDISTLGGTFGVMGTAGNGSGKALALNALNGSSNDLYALDMIPVKTGDQFYIEYEGRHLNTAGTGTSGIGFRTYGPTKAAITWSNVAAYGSTRSTVWQKKTGTYTVPAGTAYLQIWATFSASNETTNQIWFDNIVVRRKNGGELIVDGAIQAGSAIIGTGAIGNAQIGNAAVDTAQIKDAAISNAKIGQLAVKNANIDNGTIQAAKIGSVDAGTITVGQLTAGQIASGAITTTHMTSGTIDAGVLTAGSITAAKIAAKSIGVDKLTISSTDNLIMEADFSNGGSSWQIGANNTINATAGRGSLAAMRFTGVATAITSINLNNKVPIGADARFRGSMWVTSSAAAAANIFRIVGRFYTTATAYTDVVIASNDAMAANTWTNVSGIVPATIPAGTIAVSFYIYVQNAAAGTITDIDFVSVTRAADGKLLVDGAIDGKTITGATVQTAATGARIVLDQNALNAWNTNGDNYFNMSSATGVNIASIGTVGYDVMSINYCTNPSMEVNISGWTSAQTVVRDATKAYTGAGNTGVASLKATHTATLDRTVTRTQSAVPDGEYTLSFYVFHNAAAAKNVRAEIYFTDGAGATMSSTVGTAVSVPPNVWTRISVGGTSPTGSVNVKMNCVGVAFTSADTLWIDAVLLDNAYLAVNSYFDGSATPYSNITYAWQGTSGLSYSETRKSRDVTIKTGQNDVLIPQAGQSPGVGFTLPASPPNYAPSNATPYLQTAGLFSDGQTVSLVEGSNDTQGSRLDVGAGKVSMFGSAALSVRSKGSIDIVSQNGTVSLNGAYFYINDVPMPSASHWAVTSTSSSVPSGSYWGPGTPAYDTTNTTSSSLVSWSAADTIKFLNAGIYAVSVNIRFGGPMQAGGNPVPFVSIEPIGGTGISSIAFAKGPIGIGDTQGTASIPNIRVPANQTMKFVTFQNTGAAQVAYWRIQVTRIG